ncbi:MAG TPA: glucosamine-6-phosphate deaminase, partial [Dermatophilaceae bacterium]|nr:glucosamine-6-phosphate deaminase [Dermatophilaceae bacterium]
MEVVITTPPQAASLVADAVTAIFRGRPDAVLGVATGSTPVLVYNELGRRVERGELSLARARAFMLDEYVGLPEGHPERYRTV